jgi:hypothetical protein
LQARTRPPHTHAYTRAYFSQCPSPPNPNPSKSPIPSHGGGGNATGGASNGVIVGICVGVFAIIVICAIIYVRSRRDSSKWSYQRATTRRGANSTSSGNAPPFPTADCDYAALGTGHADVVTTTHSDADEFVAIHAARQGRQFSSRPSAPLGPGLDGLVAPTINASAEEDDPQSVPHFLFAKSRLVTAGDPF